MKAPIITFIVAFLLVGAVSAEAQQVYDLNKAKFFWTWAQGNGGAADGFKIKCGGSAGNYNMSTTVPDPNAREFPVRPVVGGSGQYYCVIVTYNKVGDADPSGEIFFYVALSPSSSTDFKIGY